MYLRFIICLCILSSIIEAKDSVPVLIWNDKMPQANLPAVSALQVISMTAFQEKYLQSFEPNNILLFLQDSLSIEDLSNHHAELNQISKQIETSHSLYLPAVEDTGTLIHKLRIKGYKIMDISSGSSLAGLSVNEAEKTAVVVELSSTNTNPSRKNSLQKSDEIIANVLSKIGKFADFTVIFTGKKTSETSLAPHIRTSRSLSRAKRASDSGTGNLYQSKCVMLYLRDKITVNGRFNYDLDESNFAKTIGDCSKSDVSTIQLYYIDVNASSKLDKVKLGFTFTKKNRYWTMTEAYIEEWQGAKMLDKVLLYPRQQMDYVPLTKSYSCGLLSKLYSQNSTGGNVPYEVTLPSLQVEAFTTVNQPKFHNSWDCVGFFTIPIWTGIFTGIILTFILLFGLYMLSDVKTMDRFDDPKGKNFMQAAISD